MTIVNDPPEASPLPAAAAVPRRYWLWGFAFAAGLTVAIATSIRNVERLHNETSFQAAAVERIDRLSGGIDRALGGLTALGAYFDAAPDLERAEFVRLAQPFLLGDSPVQALEWVPRVTQAQRRERVAAARRYGAAGFEITERNAAGRFVPAASRPEYFPVFFVAPLSGNERALGFDLASHPARGDALERALATGAMTATGRITLVQERGDQFGFLAFRPVFRGAVAPTDRAQRRASLVGFVLSAMRVGDIVAGSERLPIVAERRGAADIELTLLDEDAPPAERQLYPKEAPGAIAAAAGASAPGALELRRSLTVAGRNWRVIARPRRGAFVADHFLSGVALLLGSLLALVWTAYLRRLLQIKADSEAAVARHVAALQEERNFNDAILGAAGALIVVSDRQGRIVRFNRAAEEFTGCRFGDVQGKPLAWNRFRLAAERDAPSAAFEAFRIGGQPERFERIWRNASGEHRLIDWTVSTISDAKGVPQFLIALGLDITAQKRLEVTARDQEARLRTILENLGEGVCTLDARGRVTYLNARAQEMLGWSLQELAGRSALDFIGDAAPSAAAPGALHPILAALQRRCVYRSSSDFFRCKDGSALAVKVSGAPLLGAPLAPADDPAAGPGANPAADAAGGEASPAATGLVVLFSDVRAEQQLQQRLVEARDAAEAAARSKADFLSTMSHEIRTPLNGVIGMTDILLDTPLGAEQIEFVRIIKTSADALNATIDDILDFSKIEAGRLELERIEFSLQQVVESSIDIVALRAQEKRLGLASYIDPALPDHFIGDPLRIRQVLLNFLSNAVKFSAQGQILVSAMGADRTADRPGGSGVRLSVRDGGIGIARDAQARLFRPFAQADSSTSRKFGGTGLGLAICKRLVEAMGGQIGVDSEPGSGATFWIVLPLAPGPGATAAGDPTVCDQRILIAGADSAQRALWQRYVEGWRMRCEVAPDLATLRSQVDRLLAAGERIDAVLLAEPLGDAPLEQAVEALRGRAGAILCCLDEMPHGALPDERPRAELKARLARLGAVVLPRPARQSALLDALLTAWSKSCAAAAGVPAPAQAPRAAAPVPAARGRLLLAEDHPVNQRVAVVVLEKFGFAVDVVDNGAAAIERAASGSYSLVLMDCQMPGIDGFQATAAIRTAEGASGRRTPIIALTANALDGDRQRCLDAGMDDYLPKPIDALALEKTLERWIDRPHPARRRADPPGAAASAPGLDREPHESPPAAAGAPSEPAVELARLVEMFGDERATIVELLEVFRTSIEQSRDSLARERTQPAARLQALAHEIKGMAANMGAGPLARIAARLEDSARRQDREEIERLAHAIEDELPRVLGFIDGYVASSAATP